MSRFWEQTGFDAPEEAPEPFPGEQVVQLNALVLVVPDDLHVPRPVRAFFDHLAEDLFGFLDRVWPDGLTTTLYVSNVGNDPNAPDYLRNLLLRPVCEGPMASEWAVGGMTLGLEVYRKRGQLVVRRVELTPHVLPRDFEVRVVAPIRWRSVADAFMNNHDFAVLGGLPFHRAHTRTRLEEWRRYLDWKEALIHKNQVSIPYAAWRWQDEEQTVLAFLVHEHDRPDRKLHGMDLGATEAVDEDDDVDDDAHRRGRRKRPPKVTRLGEVEWAGHLDLRDPWDANWGDVQVSRKHGKVCIRLDEETAEALQRRGLPDRGRLVSSIAGDLAPLRNQQSGVHRLNNSQGFSARLADFIFSSRSAGAPPNIDDLEPLPGSRELNPGQREAVAKALAAPDLCLVQGPPGTGKTTVIADICLRATKEGKRVLVASQTNLAVDNALARLAEVPWVRPLRLGDPGRVDEEFRDFLAENVVDRWFGSIADHCRARVRAGEEAAARLARWDSAVGEMRSSLHAFEAATQRGDEAAITTRQARSEVEDTHQARGQAQGRVDGARGRVETRDALENWAHGRGPLPPAAVSEAWPAAVALPDELPPGPTLLALDRLRARGDALHTVMQALDRAAAGGSADVEAAAELRRLREEKLTLIDSDEAADMQRLRLVNRRMKELKGSGWTGVTSELHRAARAAWPEGPPPSIAQVVDALEPSSQLLGVVQQARTQAACEHAEAQAAAEAVANSSDHWARSAQQARVELGQAEEALRAAEDVHGRAVAAREDAARREGVATGEVTAAVERWNQAWRQLWEDAEPQPPSMDAVDVARRWVTDARDEQASRLERAFRWRKVQGEWVQRLARVTDSDREHLQALYVRHSNVVGMTCNEAGKRKTWQDADFRPFEIVIVDEVSKATPPELILPLLLGEKAILVGDHRQLPPMFRERDATFGDAAEEGEVSKEDFERFKRMVTSSLFEELFEEAPDGIKAMLWTQYRMHPRVMDAVNEFYEGRLEAGPSRTALETARNHRLNVVGDDGGRIVRPQDHLVWIDSSRGPDGRHCWEGQRGSSKVNELEVDVIGSALVRLGRALQGQGYGPTVELTLPDSGGRTWLDALAATLPEIPRETLEDLFAERRIRVGGRAQKPDGVAHSGAQVEVRRQKEVGVITFYGAQLGELRRGIDRGRSKHRDAFATMELRTNTVDRFQGMEKPIVLVSLVRAKKGRLGSFVREYQRINVGLSRAQQLLVVVGAEDTWARAQVPLPPLDGGVTRDVEVYRNILELARQAGGRRLARQFLLS